MMGRFVHANEETPWAAGERRSSSSHRTNSSQFDLAASDRRKLPMSAQRQPCDQDMFSINDCLHNMVSMT